MSQMMVLSDTLYARLQAEAHRRGLGSVEQLLEIVVTPDADLVLRQAAVRRVTAVQQYLDATYGLMLDSAELVRADRER